MSQRKKEFQHMKNIIRRKVKQRNKEDRMRLALFKVICFPLILLCILTKKMVILLQESYKGKKMAF